MFEALKSTFLKIEGRKIISLFEDETRATEFSLKSEDILFDYSKTNIDATTRSALLNLLEDRNFYQKRLAMFSGAKINKTEDRAVLHTALRNLDGDPIQIDGEDIMPKVLATLGEMQTFSDAVRNGKYKGQGGAFTDVVNIGIGGSDLGPAMATLALSPYHDGPACHFVSNIDGAHIGDKLRTLNPEKTLVIIASKTFATIETMTNAKTALDWMSKRVRDPAAQFVALSNNADRTAAFGIPGERVFGFADWVGGRYSLWGPIGLSLMIAIGPDNFQAFLHGANTMDQHFLTAEPKDNMPVMLALVGIWHHQICGYRTRAVLPYDQRLNRFPAYLQQLEMESNGKRVTMEGEDINYSSGPVVWGETGTNGQHAFYQLIHQGTQIVPCEFLVAAKGHEPDLSHHHTLLLANCLAQSQALMLGRSLPAARKIFSEKGISSSKLEKQAKHGVFEGNRPSTTLIYPKLTPSILGKIIALYEHRVFVEGIVLNINSFDQWGVELGKELASALELVLKSGEQSQKLDPSTRNLMKFIRSKQL